MAYIYEQDRTMVVRILDGEVFVLEDAGSGMGYRIGAEEFAKTHRLH